MLEYWNIGMMETNANPTVTFSASGIAPILHCIFSRGRNVRFVLLSLFQSSIIPLFHGMAVIFSDVYDPCFSLSAEMGLRGAKVQLGIGWYSAHSWAASSVRASVLRTWDDPFWGRSKTTYVGVEYRVDSVASISLGPYISVNSDKTEWIVSISYGIPIWVFERMK